MWVFSMRTKTFSSTNCFRQVGGIPADWTGRDEVGVGGVADLIADTVTNPVNFEGNLAILQCLPADFYLSDYFYH